MWQHSGVSLEIDHVVLCVESLDLAVRELEAKGLPSVDGGRHVGHGTGNRIVPLGDAYLELVAVLDPAEASKSVFGRWVAENATRQAKAHGLCLRTDDLDSVCDRLELAPVSMGRQRPDGAELRWRLAGLEVMVSDGFPFFIEWQVDPQDHPGVGEGIVASVEATIHGHLSRLAEWVPHSAGLTMRQGRRAALSVVVGSGNQRILL